MDSITEALLIFKAYQRLKSFRRIYRDLTEREREIAEDFFFEGFEVGLNKEECQTGEGGEENEHWLDPQ